jgi:hypothetical protein
MSEPRSGANLLSVVRRFGIFVLVTDIIVVVLDYLLIRYVDLSFLWNWLPGSTVTGTFHTFVP